MSVTTLLSPNCKSHTQPCWPKQQPENLDMRIWLSLQCATWGISAPSIRWWQVQVLPRNDPCAKEVGIARYVPAWADDCRTMLYKQLGLTHLSYKMHFWDESILETNKTKCNVSNLEPYHQDTLFVPALPVVTPSPSPPGCRVLATWQGAQFCCGTEQFLLPLASRQSLSRSTLLLDWCLLLKRAIHSSILWFADI